MSHSIIPPSSAARRVQCPGSATLELMYPEQYESDASREGTASHELAERLLDCARRGQPYPTADEVVGQTASNGVVWRIDSYEGARMYAEDVAAVMHSTRVFGGPGLLIEQRVHASRVHAESWGTPDCALYDKEAHALYLWDYKFGHGPVEVVENWQLLTYAQGVIERLFGDKAGLLDGKLRIVLRIVQPRAIHRDGPIRQWALDDGLLRGYVNTLADVEAAALGDNPPTRVGPMCKYCNARHACATLQAAAWQAVELSGTATPAELDGPGMSVEIRQLRAAKAVLEARLSGVEAQAEQTIREGKPVPGWALEGQRGRERWTVEPDELFAIGDMMQVDLRNVSPCTPKQAIKRGIDASVIKEYSDTPQTGVKLVESTKTAAHAAFAKR